MSTNNNRGNKEIRPIWLSKEMEAKPILCLSGAKLERMVLNDLSLCTAVTLAGRGIKRIDDLKCFGKYLRRLDLSNNELNRLQGFVSLSSRQEDEDEASDGRIDRRTADDGLDNGTKGLGMLNISSNAFKGDSGLEDLRYLTELRTLNISHNPSIQAIRSHIVKPLINLQALIANDCGLESAAFVRFLPHLNTLILSDNKLTALLMKEYGRFFDLKKLSLSRNNLSTIPDLSTCSSLTELRLNQNSIATIPADFVAIHEKGLKLLDLSNNLIADWELMRLLSRLGGLTNLSLHGNPLCLSPPEIDTTRTLREDISADQIVDSVERAYRHNVLLSFQRQVGKQAKLFVQLIVLDNKRVKTKWTQGGAHAHGEPQHVINQVENVNRFDEDSGIDNQDVDEKTLPKSETKKKKRKVKKTEVVPAVSEELILPQAIDESIDYDISRDQESVQVIKKQKQYHIDDDKLKSVFMNHKQQLEEYGMKGWN